ncbi:membrane protein insertion efficiency factor YidD [uncultured Gemmiger sp.]|uniref:membrane protein insertion efficiency factor YidD n=1 Tax=uncultured Gemmiger sp. TaxID=1623490 RepID=UPI0025CB9217|nr:membrane protein insertion efficiency factor YidD [uncultured Gemmiger sp.]
MSPPLLTRPLIRLIRLYQKYLSPRLGHHCRFTPTCSQYAAEALAAHGLVKGGLLALWRIARCNPFGRFGYDPVPPKGRWTSPDRRLTREK